MFNVRKVCCYDISTNTKNDDNDDKDAIYTIISTVIPQQVHKSLCLVTTITQLFLSLNITRA